MLFTPRDTAHHDRWAKRKPAHADPIVSIKAHQPDDRPRQALTSQSWVTTTQVRVTRPRGSKPSGWDRTVAYGATEKPLMAATRSTPARQPRNFTGGKAERPMPAMRQPKIDSAYATSTTCGHGRRA